ncbi:MAG: mechanosensitive ion channel domain-containing protein [Thermoproteota archaeon]
MECCNCSRSWFCTKDIIPASISGSSNQRLILKIGQKVRLGDITGMVTTTHLLHVIITNDKNENIVIPTRANEQNNSNSELICCSKNCI